MAIPVFLSSDNNYAPFVATAMASILKNTKSCCDFYVLDGGISKKNKEKICSVKNVEFVKVEIEKFLDSTSYSNTSKHVSISTFNRLLIPDLMPNLNKVIYLDVDIIVNSDICYLFEQKNNYVIAAVKEPGDKINLAQLNNNIGLAENNNYFNAGVMLMNCNKWRENNITQKIFNLYKNKPNLKYADQDLLNIYFENNCTLLPDKFNRVCLNDDTVIIHYTGATKPWHINPDNCSFEEVKLFWKYAKMTPFYDELYSKTLNGAEQKQKYMLYRIQRMAKSRFYEQ